MIQFSQVSKLGERIASISRPVGPTCPDDCPLLDDGCYGQRHHYAMPNVQQSLEDNYNPASWTQWQDENLNRLLKYRPEALRIDVVGDLLRHDDVSDTDYVDSVAVILRAYRDSMGEWLPAWLYTHAWRILSGTRERAMLADCRVEIFASVHSYEDARIAESIGYRVAMTSDVTKAIGRQAGIKYDPAIQSIVCPEQIGTKEDCLSCGFCFRPGGNVTFLRH